MKRLTKRNEVGYGVISDVTIENGIRRTILTPHEASKIQEALNRLAAYEDAGLMPEEVGKLKTELEDLRREVDGILADQKFVQMLKENGVDVDAGIRHMEELIEAEKDGRLVVLDEPRKPLVWGDDTHDTILCPSCNHDLMGGFPEDEYCENPMYQCPYCGCSVDCTKALTHQEAEEALREEAEHG